jgi:hypothetical protein
MPHGAAFVKQKSAMQGSLGDLARAARRVSISGQIGSPRPPKCSNRWPVSIELTLNFTSNLFLQNVVFTNVESGDRIIYAIFSRFPEDWKNHPPQTITQAA